MNLTPQEITSYIAGFAVIGTVFGVVVRGWSSIKSFLQSCYGLFVVQANLEDETTNTAVVAYLIKHYRRGITNERSYGGRHESFINGMFGYIPYEMLGNKTIMFWNKGIPFWLKIRAASSGEGKKEPNYITYGPPPKEPMKASLVYLRHTIDPEAIIREASRERNERYKDTGVQVQQKRFFVKKIPDARESAERRYSANTQLAWYHEGTYRLLDHKANQLGRPSFSTTKATNTLYFPPTINKVIQEATMWRDLKEWYQQRNIPWKRGLCLYGIPGTGKTAMARALAEDLDMPLFVFSLGHMIDEDLEKSWYAMQAHTPCVALLEDFDTIFHGRENVYGKPTLCEQIEAKSKENQVAGDMKRGLLSFGCLLNCIDGADKTNGIFTIITTNHIDKLDPALGVPRKNKDGTMELISTRPGRIDKAVELGYMENDDKLKLAKRIFWDNEVGYEIMEKAIQNNPDQKETPAQFQERCAQLALELLWNSNSKKEEAVDTSKNGRLKHPIRR